ncbi:FadR/GntR family transcriptional regulator [Methylobacterium frigidaeris]|uniref:HTH-type transcriptional repressor NanR n=1 Tax=Methylobacterium frigidaeris TaxID=2038277 RepID=A0AA37M340_9HYPH|nr:FadR/GntR family transcriptional regulator [Methylobacterium frigidaeris]PIK69920.1 GntR family transcriptional regulator [Methylobacterium frigidaeris]GJD60309.1 HTH-type transcriptional repressor NanR [Methylobacterium frigidaeris]
MARDDRDERARDAVVLPLASASHRLHGAVARDLGIAILAGRYPPGAVLPGEIAASESFSVSRTAYREAIRTLSAKGLVESRPKAGTRVSERGRWNLLDPDILAWAFETEPGEAFIRDLFELRQIVEPAAAELAAQRRTDADLARMARALDGMARHGLAVPAGRAADQSFHHAILEATGNAPLIALSSSVAAAVTWTTIYKQRRRALPRDPLPEHRALLEAIAAGEGAPARARMAELIRLALADTEWSMVE